MKTTVCILLCVRVCVSANHEVTVEKERGTNVMHVVRSNGIRCCAKYHTHNKHQKERETNIFLKSALRSVTLTYCVADPLEKMLTITSYNERKTQTSGTESLRGE